MPPSHRNRNAEEYRNEDTIVVKSDNNYWAHVSSPDSSSDAEGPEPIVASLLAQIAKSQMEEDEEERELESPEPDLGNEDQLPAYSVVESEQNARRSSQSGSRTARAPSGNTSEDKLNAMPKLRELPWRDGVDPTAEHEVGGDSRRKQIRFGCLLATRGIVQDNPCATCANGRGKFSLCIALDGFFKGACASCQLSGGPNRCTIKKTDGVDDSLNSSTNGLAEKSRHSLGKRPSLGSTKRPSSSEAPKSKRRRTTDKFEKTWQADVPDWESARPQWEQELDNSQARVHMNHSPWAAVNQPAPPQARAPVPVPAQQPLNGANGGRNDFQYSPERRVSGGGWAAVNQPVAPPPPPPQPQPARNYYDAGAGSNAAGHQSNGFGSQNSAVIPQSIPPAPQINTKMEQRTREGMSPNNDGSSALIDTLPKHKQRQLYGLISGLQGGIQHLQSELDALKKALGMDE